MFTNIDDALNYVMNRTNRNKGLDNFKEVMHLLNDPQDHFKSVHIAGTNGKGSCTHFIQKMMSACGYKVGTYTSPFLVSHLDRIRIDDKWIDATDFLYYVNKYYDLIEKYDLSMFEIDTLIMSEYFKDQQVDLAVIEVGLGGRLDSTNILSYPLIDMIVSIGFDHMDRLGDTLEKIAIEKCGIIKKDATVIVGRVDDDVLKVIEERAKDNELIYNNYLDKGNGIVFDGVYYDLNGKALYQKHNMGMALNAMKVLSRYYEIDLKILKDVLENCIWEGRFEKVCDDPVVILDGAHNSHGMKALIETIDNYDEEFCVVFAGLKDKNVNELVKLFNGHVKKIIITQFDYYRCLNIDGYDDDYLKFEDYHEAVEYALSNYDHILICGSLYFISEVRKVFVK